MKLITRDADYAIRALCYILAQKKDCIAVTELVKELGIPRPFLRKVLQKLQNARLLKSRKGKSGGFFKTDATGQLSVAEVLEVFQGNLSLNQCSFKKRPCPYILRCGLRKRIIKLERRSIAELKQITLKSLLKQSPWIKQRQRGS